MERLQVIINSHSGPNKDENQDSFFVLQRGTSLIAGVFDGVGSAKNGKIASLLAADYLKNHFVEGKHGSLDTIMLECNTYLLSKSLDEPYTTYCVVLLDMETHELEYSFMGDSRLYLFNNKYIESAFEDDRYHSSNNTITRCLGLNYYDLGDFRTFHRYARTDILICTDGFYNVLENELLDIFSILNKKNASAIKKSLEDYLLGRIKDDSTYIIIKSNV